MATYKRVDGDYVITTINVGDTVTIDTANVIINGNLDVSAAATFGSIYVPGNVSFGNLQVTGNGIVNGDFTVIGNLQATGNVEVDSLRNGATAINIPLPNGNIYIDINGIGNSFILSNTGIQVLGGVTATGNILGGNASVTGNISAGNAVFTGNVAAANLNVSKDVVAVGNVTGNYIIGDGSFLTNITAFSNIAVSRIANTTTVLGIIDAGGPISALVGGVANVFYISSTGTNVAGTFNSTGNLNAANITTAGNVTGNYILGNGALLTGVITSVANINNGTSNMTVLTSGGNIQANIAGNTVLVLSSTGANVTGTLNATGNANVGNLGATNIVGTLTTASQTSITSVGTLITLNVTGNANVGNLGATNVVATNLTGTLTTAAQPNITSVGTLSVLNVVGNTTQTGNINITGNINATGNLNYQNVTDLVVGDPLIFLGANNTANLVDLGFIATYNDGLDQHGGFARNHLNGVWGVFGNVIAEPTTVIDWGNAIYQPFRAGDITTTGIINSNANGVGNIGNSSTYFNTVFAKATSAQYADLAENYLADQEYTPGTVVVFGGEKEITTTTVRADARVAGAISTNPAYLMNAQAPGLAVALRGRIPVNVTGAVNKGDGLVTSHKAGFAESIGTDRTYGQSVFAKSLETNLESGEKIIIAIIL